MYLQAVRQLCDGLLQEQSHQQEVELRHVGVFGQQRLQHGEAREVARVPVDLSHRGAAAGAAAAHVEAWRRRGGGGGVNGGVRSLKNKAATDYSCWDGLVLITHNPLIRQDVNWKLSSKQHNVKDEDSVDKSKSNYGLQPDSTHSDSGATAEVVLLGQVTTQQGFQQRGQRFSTWGEEF